MLTPCMSMRQLQACTMLHLCLLRLQVFIHDPLYKWALTPKGVQQRQRDDPNSGQQSRPSSASERVRRQRVPATYLLYKPQSPASCGRWPCVVPLPTHSIKTLCTLQGGPGAAAVSSTTENVLANADAERALLRIKHKLDGIDTGEKLVPLPSVRLIKLSRKASMHGFLHTRCCAEAQCVHLSHCRRRRGTHCGRAGAAAFTGSPGSRQALSHVPWLGALALKPSYSISSMFCKFIKPGRACTLQLAMSPSFCFIAAASVCTKH